MENRLVGKSPERKRLRLPACSPSVERELQNAEIAAAKRSLIAFDVDKTVLHQGDAKEMERFRSGMAQTLVTLASLGFNLAAVTGNHIGELSTRFMKGLIQELCAQRCLELISHFHFFCNGAALYIHLSPTRNRCEHFADLLSRASELDCGTLLNEAIDCFFDGNGEVLPCFISVSYAQQCCIPMQHAQLIMKLCEDEAASWWASATPTGKFSSDIIKQFYVGTGDDAVDRVTAAEAEMDKVNKEASVYKCNDQRPVASMHTTQAADGQRFVTSCNVKPILSFRHARQKLLPHTEDPRIQMVKRLRNKLTDSDLTRYLVNPGGRGSIDITHHLVTKRSAITYLMRHLGCEGVQVLGEPKGVNCVFFGDEVVFNGNDLSVAEIPGITVFAVNEQADRVPFHTNIELPYETSETGPEATKAILDNIIAFTKTDSREKGKRLGRSAIARWKEERIKRSILVKCKQVIGEVPPHRGMKFSYSRLEAIHAALTGLLRKGEGLDGFAINLMGAVNQIGSVTNQVREQQFDAHIPARGFCKRYIGSPITARLDDHC